jgi:putative ABC transport system permease protein
MVMESWLRASKLALEGVIQNRVRSLLTALGIVFGVGAVIAMLAIGKGAQKSIMDRLELVGTNNIVVKAEFESDPTKQAQSESDGGDRKPWSPGLTYQDARAIQLNIPSVAVVSPQFSLNAPVIFQSELINTRVYGVSNAYFDLAQLPLQTGSYFTDFAEQKGQAVCVLGPKLASRLFQGKSPIGENIKLIDQWFTVVGVIQARTVGEDVGELGVNETDMAVFVPVRSAFLRLEDRGRITNDDLRKDEDDPATNYHQLDLLTLKVKDGKYLKSTAEIVNRMLLRRHNTVKDFSIIIPEVLIEQQQKTQDTFNWVLAAIAGISLLVGGIGIMNIMLASVMERIREIGIRRSLGATQQDVIRQFLLEAMMISLIGGILGIVLGVLLAVSVAYYADIPTVISPASILLSFFVAAAVGLIFGWYPAQKAAKQDPIQALRTD